MKKLVTLIFVAAVTLASPVLGEQPDWHEELERQLPVLGHRNWIVVADAAYPSQTAPGIKTIYTGEKQLETVDKVLKAIGKTKHVRSTVFLDKELEYVPEKLSKGADAFRAALKKSLKGQNVKSLPHSQIIDMLDEAGQKFHVLLLKTDLTIPYTSVFIRLDCGYWSDDAEMQMRAAIEAAEGAKK